MSGTPEKIQLDKKDFLLCHSFSDEEFKEAGLDWGLLEAICSSHTSNIPQLQTTADYISQRLRQIPAVHSLKVRIKHPEHLIAKIIRKKLDHPELQVTLENYPEFITDLIGIRALHLFKDEWQPIHDFVITTWELNEKPIAYLRDGDPKPVFRSFQDRGCNVQEHAFGYRSLHYLIKSQPAKSLHLAELQVRTLFEEGWSEIDHQVRYPRVTDNPHLSEFLTIFNRLAGSADEMGTFIKKLSGYMSEQSAKLAEREAQIDTKEMELKKAISELKISKEEKKKLEAQVEELRKSSSYGGFSLLTGEPINVAATTVLGLESSSWYTGMSPGIAIGDLKKRVCKKCGRTFQDELILTANDCCPKCQGDGFFTPPT